MLTLTDDQADKIADAMAREAGAILLDKDNPPAFLAPFWGAAWDVAGAVVSIATGGKTSARALKQDAAQTVLNLVLLPGAWKGNAKAQAVAHECAHVHDWFTLAWNGADALKIHQPFPVEYVVNKHGRAMLEGRGYGAQADFLVHALGATADEMRAFLTWLRDVELPSYDLGPEQCGNCVAVVDSWVTGALAGAAPNATTRAALAEMRALGITPPSNTPSAPSAR